MPISLTIKEKCYIVALFGDISLDHRERLFRYGRFPAQAGPIVMKWGYEFVAELNNGQGLFRKRGPHPALDDEPSHGGSPEGENDAQASNSGNR